jgi:hypothetical protein
MKYVANGGVGAVLMNFANELRELSIMFRTNTSYRIRHKFAVDVTILKTLGELFKPLLNR